MTLGPCRYVSNRQSGLWAGRLSIDDTSGTNVYIEPPKTDTSDTGTFISQCLGDIMVHESFSMAIGHYSRYNAHDECLQSSHISAGP